MQIEFLGSRLDALTMDQTVDLIADSVEHGRFVQHCVVNVAKLVHMQSDPELRESVESCDVVNIDGMGIVWGARFLGLEVPERVAGIDLFHRLLQRCERSGSGVFLLGATQEVLDAAIAEIRRQRPGLRICGAHHGYFWKQEREVVDQIRASGAQFLFVAISSPMKEKFIARWRDALGVKFVMGVGGTFDVVAGKVRRAPPWMQKSGMEWLFRLLQEPRRMWRRYLVTNSRYMWMLLRARISG